MTADEYDVRKSWRFMEGWRFFMALFLTVTIGWNLLWMSAAALLIHHFFFR